MAKQQDIDITPIAVLAAQFPPHLMQLGFRLFQMVDATGNDQLRYVIPPVCIVPAGPFLMGDNKEQVMVASFAISTYPLTVAEYHCYQDAIEGPSRYRRDTPLDHPKKRLSQDNAIVYVDWLAKITGKPWRLPIETEWEKAARGLDGRIYPWGNEWDETRLHPTGPVGSADSIHDDASPYGVHDMVGKVWQWAKPTNRTFPHSILESYTVRGGLRLPYARVTYRVDIASGMSTYDIGARLVCEAVS